MQWLIRLQSQIRMEVQLVQQHLKYRGKASLMITRKEYDAALKYLDSIKCDMETDQDIRHSIAMEKSRIYAYQQKMDMAISALEEAKAILIEKNEFDIEATYLLMNCYLNNEDFEKVINAAKELKKVQGEDYYVLAAYYYEHLR